MKVLNKIKKIFTGIIIVIFSIFALIMTVLLLNFNDYGVTEFGEQSLVIIRQEVSTTEFKKGDLVIVEKVNYDDIKIGDEVFAYNGVNTKKVTVTFGKVGELYPKERSISYENSNAGYSEQYIIGKATDVYSDIGKYLAFFESKWGFFFTILVPGFIIFIYEIYALIVEIRYGDEDEK